MVNELLKKNPLKIACSGYYKILFHTRCTWMQIRLLQLIGNGSQRLKKYFINRHRTSFQGV